MYSKCWLVGLCDAATLLQHSLILFYIHPSVPTIGPERKEQLVLYWSVSVLLLQAFCQELVLSNHTIHLSHSFRLQPVINKHTNYKSKMNFCFIKQWAGTASGLQLKSTTSAKKKNEHKLKLECAKYVANNFQKRTSSRCVGRMSFSHEGADIFCMSHSFQLQTHASLRPQPCLLWSHIANWTFFPLLSVRREVK